MLFQLDRFRPIATRQEFFCYLISQHDVPSSSTLCDSPQTNDSNQAAISQIVADLVSLSFEPRRHEAPRILTEHPNHGVFGDAVLQVMTIPTQSSLLKPASPDDNAVANASNQRLAEPLTTAAPATVNSPPPAARSKCDPDDRELLLKSANRLCFTK